MSKRFLDVFLVSFLFNIVMIIIILVFYQGGINLIENCIGAILLACVISLVSSYIIYKRYICSGEPVYYYKLGATNNGNKYRKALIDISKKFQSRTMDIYNDVVKAETKSIKGYNEYLYLNAYVDSRNELIENLVKAFDEIDDLSIEDLNGSETK